MRIKDSSPCAFCDCVFLALAKQGEFTPKGSSSPCVCLYVVAGVVSAGPMALPASSEVW